jgi:hypothetical protein
MSETTTNLNNILNNQNLMIEMINKKTGTINRIYFDGTIEGFQGFTTLNLATPFIRQLLYHLSENQNSKSLVPPITGLTVAPSGLSDDTAE